MWVEWEDGAHLSQSRTQPGDYSPLTRDGDNNLGHVILREIDEEDKDEVSWDPEDSPPDWPSEEELEVIALAVIAVIVAASRAAPHIHRWWKNQVMPFLRRSATRTRRRLGRKHRVPDGGTSVVTYLAPAESQPGVTAALVSYRANMSSEEARERLVAALVARMFSEEQLSILRDARIDDDGPSRDLARAIEALTPEQLAESIELLLATNPSWPNRETVTELDEILEQLSTSSGRVLLPPGSTRGARRLLPPIN